MAFTAAPLSGGLKRLRKSFAEAVDVILVQNLQVGSVDAMNPHAAPEEAEHGCQPSGVIMRGEKEIHRRIVETRLVAMHGPDIGVQVVAGCVRFRRLAHAPAQGPHEGTRIIAQLCGTG
jgi:hypothetical protein